MTIYTASFYEPDHWHGKLYRISRSWPRGFRQGQFGDLPFLFPDTDSIRRYRGKKITWPEFRDSYGQKLEDEEKETFLQWLNSLKVDEDVTLLCFEGGVRTAIGTL